MSARVDARVCGGSMLPNPADRQDIIGLEFFGDFSFPVSLSRVSEAFTR